MADSPQPEPPFLLLLASKLGYQTRSFAEAARRLGAEVILGSDRCHQLDDPWADGAIPLHFEEPPEAAERLAQAVRARAGGKSRGAILALGDRQTVTAAYAARLLGLPYNSPEAVENCRSKLRQREVLRGAGLPVPDFFSFALAEPLDSVVRRVAFPCVVKPLRLSASQGVIRANDRGEFIAAVERIARMLSSAELQVTREGDLDRLLVERYIPGAEVAVEGLLESGRLRVLALFDKPDPLEGPYFEETIYVTPSSLTESQQLAIQKCAQDSARAIGLTRGPVHVEFRIHGDGEAGTGVWPLEIAARPIGGLCARALRFVENESQTLENKNATTQASIGLEELLLLHSLDLPVSTWMRERRASGVMMIPVPSSGILESVQGEAAARETPGITELLITARLHDYIEAWPEGASYLGFLFAAAETPREVEQTLRDAHAKLRFTMIPRLPVQHPAQHASGKSAR